MRKTIASLLFASFLLVVGAAISSSIVPRTGANGPEPVPTPWPDLSTISLVNHKSCTLDGAGAPESEKAKLNQLKNRFRLPSGNFEAITFDEILALDQGRAAKVNGKRKIVDFPDSTDANNARAVILEGFVKSVKTSGCARPSGNRKGGESCNCNSFDPVICDIHIEVIPDENVNINNGRNVVVVEITKRSRMLASQGLLSTNVGKDWTTQALKPKLENHRVRFSGFLYFDTDHFDQAFQTDPTNKIGRSNFRQTAWEVHPVMGIKVLN